MALDAVLYIVVRRAGEVMWPRRSTIRTTPGAIEKRPLLAADAIDDGPLVAGCGKVIGVKAESMGYVVVDAPCQAPAAQQSVAPQKWGAVAAALKVNIAGGRRKTTLTPVPDSSK